MIRVTVLNLRTKGYQENGLLVCQWETIIADIVQRLMVEQFTLYGIIQVNVRVQLKVFLWKDETLVKERNFPSGTSLTLKINE